MYRKIQKPTMICIIGIFLFLIIFMAFTPIFQTHTAQAQTFEQHIPTFGLYCKDKDIIQTGTVKYDLSDAETVAQGKGVMQSNYQIAATNRTVEFAIPFISSAINAPSFSITANEKNINGSICYGNIFFMFNDDTDFETLIDDTYSADIDDNLNGTLYTITPDNETLSIELSFADGKRNSFIYETSNHLSSSTTATGTYTWTLKNALIKSEYKFFILGENTDHSFSCSSEYQTETISCKDFIDCQYEPLKELYDEYGIAVDFFYSMVNRTLKNKQSIEVDDLFFNSINTQRFNVYKFTLPLDTATTVSYELPINIQQNFAFNPTIYLVEQKNLCNFPIRYTAELNNEIPYLIEASTKTEKNGTTYIAETADDYYFVFCASEKPQSPTVPNNSNNNLTLIICCSVIGVIAFIALIVLIGMAIHQKVKR